MSKFNHRVVKGTDEINGVKVDFYAIYEIYYDDQGNPDGFVEKPIVVGNDFEDLVGEVSHLVTALGWPVIDLGDLPKTPDSQQS